MFKICKSLIFMGLSPVSKADSLKKISIVITYYYFVEEKTGTIQDLWHKLPQKYSKICHLR